MRSAFAAVFVLGLAALIAVGATQGSGVVYSVGAVPAGPAVELPAGAQACQQPVRVPDGAAFDRVTFTLGLTSRTGPAIDVEIVDDRTGRRLASGRLAAGYADRTVVPEHVVPVDRVDSAAPLRVCLENDGPRTVLVYGQAGAASPTTLATVEGEQRDVDMAVTLEADERSLLALLPTIAERASRFRAGWIGPLVYGVLGVLVLVGAPLLLARGIARAAAADRSPGPDALP